jgi:hypothetical protein
MRGLVVIALAVAWAYTLLVLAALSAFDRWPGARWVRAVLRLEAWVSDTFWGVVGWVVR